MLKHVKTMKLLLINYKERIEKSGCENISLGVLSIASYLIKKGTLKKSEIKIIDSFYDDIEKEIVKFKPTIIGFSVITPFYLSARNTATIISKKFSKVKLLIGGSHISSEKVLDKPFDYGLVGEGEDSLHDLLISLKNEDININSVSGLIRRDGKEIITNKNKGVSKNIDIYSNIDWSLVKKDRLIFEHEIITNGKYYRGKSVQFNTSRGCPFKCIFCAYNTTWGGSGVRYISIEIVMKQILELHNNYGVTLFWILDDTFSLNKKRLIKLIDALKKAGILGKINFYNVFARADLIDNEMAELLFDLGVLSVFIGVESGSQKIIDLLKKNTIKISDVLNSINILEKMKISVLASFMLYSPKETKSDLIKTKELIKWILKKKNIYFLNICITTPFPGTELWKYPENNKYRSDRELYLGHVSLDNKNIEGNIFYLNKKITTEQSKLYKFTKDMSSKLNKNINNKLLFKRLMLRLLTKLKISKRFFHVKSFS